MLNEFRYVLEFENVNLLKSHYPLVTQMLLKFTGLHTNLTIKKHTQLVFGLSTSVCLCNNNGPSARSQVNWLFFFTIEYSLLWVFRKYCSTRSFCRPKKWKWTQKLEKFLKRFRIAPGWETWTGSDFKWHWKRLLVWNNADTDRGITIWNNKRNKWCIIEIFS